MNKRPRLCKEIELASYLFEDGAIQQSIDILENALIELKEIRRKRDVFYKKLNMDIAKSHR